MAKKMDLAAAQEILGRYGQEHLLAHFDTLSQEEQETLLQQVGETDFSVLSHLDGFLKEKETQEKAGRSYAPAPAMELPEIRSREGELRAAGLSAIRAGKAAAMLLAGGMGTRLGWEGPKGTFDIGKTRPVYIFQRIIENLLDVAGEAGCHPRLFIMTSEKNHEETVSFLEEHQFFGYPAEKVLFFKQDMAPACDYEGKVFLESPSRIATSPNGNAGWYGSLMRAGYGNILKEEGIEYINVFAVDNVLQRILDPCFVGACILAGADVGSKVVRKVSPDEKVGVICLEDGRPSIVEYYELSEEMKGAGYEFGVILNYLFKVSALEAVAGREMPMHVVEKKIPHLGPDGTLVKPDAPNGYKFEQLVLDLIHMMDSCLSYEVVREKEFAPVKNAAGADSVETAQRLCEGCGIAL